MTECFMLLHKSPPLLQIVSHKIEFFVPFTICKIAQCQKRKNPSHQALKMKKEFYVILLFWHLPNMNVIHM